MAEIDLTPTEEMAANAARGLELRRKHGKGGTEIGVARARDISNRKNLSPETVRRMHAFFSRHEKNKAGGEDDAGYIAWLLWGGDSGQSWAKRKVEQMNKGENQRSDTYKEIAQRLGSAAKMAKVDRARVLKELRALRDNARAERNREAERLASMYLAGLNRANTTEDDWEEADMATSKILDVLHGEYARPGAKAKFAQSLQDYRSLIGEYNALDKEIGRLIDRAREMSAKSDRILSLFPKNERDPDAAAIAASRQAMAELRKELNVMLSRFQFSRPGTKAKFAQPPFSASDLNALKRLVKQYEKLGKESAGELDRAHHHKALAIASTLHEIIDFAASGKTGRAYAQVRISTPEFQKLLPASLVKAAYDVTKSDTYSRPGAKARMSKDWQTIERYLEVLDTEFGEPRGKAAAQEMMRAAAAIGGDEGARLKAAINTMATSRDYNARQRAYNAIASMMPFSRPGAKAKMAKQWREGPYVFKNKLLAEDQMQLLVNEGSGWMNAGVFMDESDTIEASKSYVQMRKRGFVYEHGQWNKARASRPGAKVANAVREGEKVSASDDAVSRKIRKLMDEGKPQKQAVAIALDLERRGEL